MPSVEEGRAFWRPNLADLNHLDLASQNMLDGKDNFSSIDLERKRNTRELSILE